MNPSLQLLLVVLISLEVSFTNRLTANLVVIGGALVVLLLAHLPWQKWLWLLVVPALPAIALFVTIVYFSPGHDLHFGWVLVSRIYLYVLAGSTVTLTISPLTLARSLEQNAHLAPKFAYGTLAAVNVLPKIKQAVQQIRAAARMRGVRLHFWSPTLYFKAILVALNWADQLAQAIESHGFVDGQARTATQTIPLRPRDGIIFTLALVGLQVLLVSCP